MGHLNNLSKLILLGKNALFWEFLVGKLGKKATYLDWEHLQKTESVWDKKKSLLLWYKSLRHFCQMSIWIIWGDPQSWNSVLFSSWHLHVLNVCTACKVGKKSWKKVGKTGKFLHMTLIYPCTIFILINAPFHEGKRWSYATLNGFMALKFCIFAHILSQEFHFFFQFLFII